MKKKKKMYLVGMTFAKEADVLDSSQQMLLNDLCLHFAVIEDSNPSPCAATHVLLLPEAQKNR